MESLYFILAILLGVYGIINVLMFILGIEESSYRFNGYKVVHLVFPAYILGRIAYKIGNIQVTKGDE